MNKCEWCEEGRYTSMPIKFKEINTLYCLDLHYDREDNKYLMEIDRQKWPSPYWELRFQKQIHYCPFCGRKLKSDSNE